MTNQKYAEIYADLLNEYPRENYKSDTEHSDALYDAVYELADGLVDVYNNDLLTWFTTEEGAEGVKLLTSQAEPEVISRAITNGGLTELARLAQFYYHLDGLNEVIGALYVDA